MMRIDISFADIVLQIYSDIAHRKLWK